MLQQIKSWLNNFKNSRLYRRVDADVPVKVNIVGEKQSVGAVIKNWSPSGVFIQIEPLVPLSSLVDLEFSIGERGDSKLKLRGQVVRHQQATDKLPPGVGIMFTDFTESGLNILRDFLSRQSMS